MNSEREDLIMREVHERSPQRSSVTRRRLLTGAGALAAAGWIAGGGGWRLRPRRASAAAGSAVCGVAKNKLRFDVIEK
jgi:hypothetical protein